MQGVCDEDGAPPKASGIQGGERSQEKQDDQSAEKHRANDPAAAAAAQPPTSKAAQAEINNEAIHEVHGNKVTELDLGSGEAKAEATTASTSVPSSPLAQQGAEGATTRPREFSECLAKKK
eukprot:CAMPEP_0170189004 /NCGR_PEP_ID=MMETSP0040_2-20121228/45749_1 /TAXON_ID=641309 /ORGANISM="Lotharella oceanica, Strain CCMP622" /LENGTH=120 /DNA_ID=CAMNT_0010436451 /DNA_START=37 /DNA_END=396 /DNA_ORIENTATION=+